MTYYVKVYPANTQFKPHIWNSFPNRKLAEYYAEQLRKTKSLYNLKKNLYSKVEVI